MITQTDIAVIERVLTLVFIMFIFAVFGATVLYIKAGRFATLHGWKIERLIKHRTERLKVLARDYGVDAGDEVVEEREVGGDEADGIDEADEKTPDESGEGADPVEEMVAIGSDIRALREFSVLARGSLVRASLWLFLAAYAALQSLLALRLEAAYTETWFSLVGFAFVPLFGFFAGSNYLRHRAVAASLQRKWKPVQNELEGAKDMDGAAKDDGAEQGQGD